MKHPRTGAILRLSSSPRRLVVSTGVGLVAASSHSLIAWALVGEIHGLAANAIGFLAAVGVTYLGYGFLTLRSEPPRRETLIRFIVVSAATLGFSEWLFVFLSSMGAADRPSIVVVAVAASLVELGSVARWVCDDQRRVRTTLRRWLVDVGVWVGAAGIGIVALWAMAPDGLLDPGSPQWRLPAGDRGTNVAGMRYFLVDDWHWPLLMTDDLNVPDGTSIAFTDSLPILALLAKLARPLLGTEINYFPSWYLLTYTLQGIGAVAVLRSLHVRRADALLTGAVLAVTFPAFVHRAFHTALTGQFIILLTLAAAFAAGRANPADGVTGGRSGGPPVAHLMGTIAGLAFALLIHPYLVVMTVVPVAGIYLDHIRRRRLTLGPIVAAASGAFVVLAAVLVGGGYLGSYEPSGGYGYFSLNVLGPAYPQLSGLLPGDEEVLLVDNTFEGFNWLGFGTLLLIAAALVLHRRQLVAVFIRWYGLIVACVVLTMLAVTHRVAYGRRGVVDLGPIGSALEARPAVIVLLSLLTVAASLALWRRGVRPLTLSITAAPVALIGAAILAGGRLSEMLSAVRASGRLWWSVGLLLMLGSVALVARSRFRAVPVLFVVVSLAQILDTVPLRAAAGSSVVDTVDIPGVERLLAAAEGATTVRIRPSFFCAPFPEGAFAVNDTVTTASAGGVVPVDTAYTSRRPYDLDCGQAPIGDLGPNELLVLVTPDRSDPGALITADHRCRDNGRLLACTSSWADVPVARTAPFLPLIAEPVTFGIGGDGELVMTDGWGRPEEWGRVIPTEGAGLVIPLVGPIEGPVTVRLRLRTLAGGPGTVILGLPDGVEHELAVSGDGPHDVEVTLGQPPSASLEFRLATHPSSPSTGVDELTILLAA